MGRHSAPDDDDEPDGSVVVAVDPAVNPAADDLRGRHTRAAELAAELAPGAEPAADPAPGPRARAAQSTTADLALIRRHGDVRNRVIGAVVVPFVLYAAVLLLMSAAASQFLIWVWVPTVTAGVLAGFVLDGAHKRYPAE